MQKQIKPTSSGMFKPIKKLFKRFHLTLFIILVVGGLSAAVLFINNTLKDSSVDPNYTSSINAGSIDQATLTRLNALHTSTEASAQPTLPAGHINPVSE
jgi:capsule polysaccharide export protein KpsE/RkpR